MGDFANSIGTQSVSSQLMNSYQYRSLQWIHFLRCFSSLICKTENFSIFSFWPQEAGSKNYMAFLLQRLLKMVDGLNFKDFVAFLSAFSAKATAQQKIQCEHVYTVDHTYTPSARPLLTNVNICCYVVIFKVYDSDCNGKVSFNDIMEVLRDLSGPFMSDDQREVFLVVHLWIIIDGNLKTDLIHWTHYSKINLFFSYLLSPKGWDLSFIVRLYWATNSLNNSFHSTQLQQVLVRVFKEADYTKESHLLLDDFFKVFSVVIFLRQFTALRTFEKQEDSIDMFYGMCQVFGSSGFKMEVEVPVDWEIQCSCSRLVCKTGSWCKK